MSIIEIDGKYDALINKAMTAAMECESPEEGINVCLSCLGDNFYSDRIFIFERDEDKSHFSNTYEWTAPHIESRKHMLQKVKGKYFENWMDSFKAGKDIYVQSIESLREPFPDAYLFFMAQGVSSFLITPIILKGELAGFFGADNPEQDKIEEIAELFASLHTSVFPLLKLRNAFYRAQYKAMLKSYGALSEIYCSMHMVNVKTNEFVDIKTNPDIDKARLKNNMQNFPIQVKAVMSNLCEKEYQDKIFAFTDITTLQERLNGEATIVCEFHGTVRGWCRARFIVVDYDENKSLHHVIFAVEVIDAEKQREQQLKVLSETDIMTGLKNRSSGEAIISQKLQEGNYGLFCILDCDKFKQVNDQFGHAVGDKVLIALAKCLSEMSRAYDVIMRLGGDEFVLYAPGLTDKNNVISYINRLFNKIGKIEIPELKGFPITVSLGAVISGNKSKSSFTDIYKKADNLLYKSKKVEGFSYSI